MDRQGLEKACNELNLPIEIFEGDPENAGPFLDDVLAIVSSLEGQDMKRMTDITLDLYGVLRKHDVTTTETVSAVANVLFTMVSRVGLPVGPMLAALQVLLSAAASGSPVLGAGKIEVNMVSRTSEPSDPAKVEH